MEGVVDRVPLATDVLEGSASGICILDAAFRVVWVNRALERMFGVDRDAIIGADKRALIQQTLAARFEDPEGFAARVLATYDDNKYVERFECHMLAGDGREERWLEHSSRPIEKGVLAGGRVEFYNDISDAKRGERNLSDARDELSRIASSISDFLWSGDFKPDGGVEYRYFSPAIETITGYPPSFYSPGPDRWLSIVHPDDRSRMERRVGELVVGQLDSLAEEFRIIRPDGTVRWVRDSIRATRLEDGTTRLDGIVTDMTDRKWAEREQRDLEERIRQTQKLESLGVLAGGLAHDFNNLLTGILGNAGLALRETRPGSAQHVSLDAIVKAAHRATELTRQMLAYSGQEQIRQEIVSLSDLVADMRELLRSSISKGASLALDLAEELPFVEADSAQIRQVVTGLVLNASDALGDDIGTIRISTRSESLEHRFLDGLPQGQTLGDGPYVVLAVTDTGCGMDEETRGRIFDPFFSTKFAGRGLGLAAVVGIVRSHRGAVSVESEPGAGTTVQLWLPSRGEARPIPDEPALPLPLAGEGRIVLVVDDEDFVREFVRATLEGLGFEVIEAAEGRSALDLFASRASEIAIVVLDRTMPQMGGDEVLRAMRRIDPTVPVVLSSGYGAEEGGESAAGAGPDGFLPKPYGPSVLAEKLAEVLGRSSDGA